VFAIVAINVSC